MAETPRLGFLAALMLATIASLAFGSSPAGAEIDSNQQTDWGLATEGPSRTVARWDALGWAVEQVDGTIFVGGKFLDVTNGSGTHRQPHLAAFDAETGSWQAWFRPTIGQPVLALQATPDGGLVVGGEIDTWDGQTIGALAKIDPATGAPWPGWSTRIYGGGSAVRDLHLGDDGWLYAVGDFSTVSRAGVIRPAAGAVRFDPITGAIDSTWRPLASGGTIHGVSTSEISDRVYLAGEFLSINGVPNTGGFVAVDDAATVVVDRTPVPFNACTDVTRSYCVLMYDVEATASGMVFVGGVEHSLYVLDETDDLDLVFHHYSGCDPSRNAVCLPSNWYGGEFQEIEEAGGRVYATCHCWYDLFTDTTVIAHAWPRPTASHTTVDALMAFDAATGQQIQGFRPYLSGDAGGWALHVNPSDGCLWAGGGFDTYAPPGGAQRSANDLLRLCDEAGPGPAATPSATAPPPGSCSIDAAGLTVTVEWEQRIGVAAAIVERSIDDGTWYWRRRVASPAVEFVESIPDNRVTSYRLRFTYPGGQQSVTVPCGEPIDRTPSLTPPASCTATAPAPGPGQSTSVATIDWEPGNDAVAYVVSRSVDGGSTYWRGRVDAPTRTFQDPVSTGSRYEYSVAARAADGSSTAPVPCTPAIELPSAELAPIAACTATGAAGVATLTWTPSTGSTSTIVHRQVDGGATHWRGRVNAPTATFDDPISDGTAYRYVVTARSASGQTSAATICTPDLEVRSAPTTPIATCSVVPDGASVTVEWVADPATVEVVVERSGDGGAWYWRGRVDGGLTSFDDSLRSGPTWTYRLVARDGAGNPSTATVCDGTARV